jgi:hypothetical protein
MTQRLSVLFRELTTREGTVVAKAHGWPPAAD